ncbi:MAG: hypothetical protein J6K64_04340 [Clostridia bacterium]|nr:hypothetical protein [Clostridia bacterium]
MENYYQIITVVIGCVAFLSPIVVSLINNRHNAKMREKEMAHQQKMKKIELEHEYAIKQLDVYYKEKKDAFSKFLISAGSIFFDTSSTKHTLNDLESAAANALLFCSYENKDRILIFLKYANNYEVIPFTTEKKREFSDKLAEISYFLNEELKSTPTKR